MARSHKYRQCGMTLIEVMVATLILSSGLLGAAAVQISALKHTDSALMTSQASFIAYSMLDRVRANKQADYRYSSAGGAVSSGVVNQDLNDFKRNILEFGGETATGMIAATDREVSITLEWSDARRASHIGSRQTLTLTSQIAIDTLAAAL